MENLITITPAKNSSGKDALKVELTLDGATHLSKLVENKEKIFLHDFHDGEIDNITGLQKWFFDNEDRSIFNEAVIGWESSIQTLAEFRSQSNPIEQWKLDPAAIVWYEADAKNEARQEEVTAKTAAGMWAVYCNQKVYAAALEANSRYTMIKEVHANLLKAIMQLKYNNYKQDDKYYETIKKCTTDMEKELGFHKQKLALLKMISKNDFNLDIPVNELYRSFRGINEEDNKTKINVTHNEDENTKEAERPNDPEGESNLSVV